MIATRSVGQSVTVTFQPTRADGTPDDPDNVTLTVTRPDGTDAGPAQEHPSLGHYEASFVCDVPGLWRWRWTASGGLDTAADGLLQVEAPEAADLYVTVGELRRDIGDSSGTADEGLLTRACREASRAIDRWCSAAAVGYRRFWLDPTPTVRRYAAADAWVLDIVDLATTAGLAVTVAGKPWTLDVDYQVAPINAAPARRPYTRLEALAATFPVSLSYAPYTSLSGQRYVHPPQAPQVTVTGRHGWPAVPDEVRKAARLQALRLYKRPGAPFGTEGVTDWGPVRIARNDPDIAPLLEGYSLGPVFA